MPQEPQKAKVVPPRRHFAHVFAAFPAALMGGNEGAALCAAVLFVLGELCVAAWAKLPILPFCVCAGGFLVLIFAAAIRLSPAASGSGRGRNTIARFLALLVMTKFISVLVVVTGAMNSPFAATLFVPVFIGALYFGVAGSAATGAAILGLFLILIVWEPTASGQYRGHFLQGIVFLGVSLFAGLLVRRLEREAQTAQARARHQGNRAARFEWLTDTATMMESLDNLEPMLAVGLLRVDELVSADTLAVFLREPDGPDFLLAQTMGIADKAVGLQRIPLADQQVVQEAKLNALVWPGLPENKDAHVQAGIFNQLDAGARSILVIPLGTLDDAFGVLYLARRDNRQFTQTEQDDLLQMARHMVYPIQRVRLQALATTDLLTGLANRRAFRRRMQTEVERATRYRHPLALLMFDVDYFKRANDTLGHRAGDALLTQMGGILRRACRGIDMAARYGGEELAIICPETDEAVAARVAERVRIAVAEHRFVLPNGGETRLTVSAGVAALPLHASDAPSLVEAADAALYDAKQSGRNRVCSAQDAETAAQNNRPL